MLLYLRTEVQTMNMKLFLKKKREQKSKIPVASLDFFTHTKFVEMQTLKKFEQLFILKRDAK